MLQSGLVVPVKAKSRVGTGCRGMLLDQHPSNVAQTAEIWAVDLEGGSSSFAMGMSRASAHQLSETVLLRPV